jgi:flagellar basal body-associated protein FliL
MDAPSEVVADPGKPIRKRHRVLKIVGVVLLVVVLVAGGVAIWALNRYVIDHVKIANVEKYEQERNGTAPSVPIATFANP